MQRISPVVLALLGGVAILLALLWFFSTNRNPDQDKLSNPQIEQSAQSDASKACSEKATYDLVKRELFRRAAELRGKDAAEFDKVSGVAVLRVENPVLEDEAADGLNCSGTFYLDLPPHLAVAGGRHNLAANIDYVLQSGGGIVLRNAEPIVGPLANLEQVAVVDPLAPEGKTAADGNVAASESASKDVGPATSAPGRPSFDCANAQTSGEAAVCADSGLAALDVNMSTQYRRALTTATPIQLQQLRTTRERFLAYRDRCPSRQCMADAYVGRMREIRDIMEGRFSPR